MLDRKKQPQLKPVQRIDFLEPQHFQIGEHAKLHWISQVDDESVKVEFIFDAGSNNGKPIISGFTNNLLMAGTFTKTANEINESIDSLGGYVQAESSKEEASFSIYGLRKNIAAIVDIVWDAIIHAYFPQDEIDLLTRTSKQRFSVNQEKVSFLARRKFTESIFGDSSYAQLNNMEDYDNIEREQLVEFHKEFYLQGLFKVVVIGNVSEKLIKNWVEKITPNAIPHEPTYEGDFENLKGKVHVEKEGAIQTAVRIGRILFNRKNPDYQKVNIVNTILGGYFGSRLMSNLREDKGYTYGVGSGIAELKESAYFFISTEVGSDVAEDAVREIKNEIEKLQHEFVPEEELLLVRNYTVGKILKGSDGPYAMMDRYLTVDAFGMDLSYYDEVMKVLYSITPPDIKEFAYKYLKWEDMIVVTAG